MSIRSTLLRCSVAAAMFALAPLPAPAQQVTKIRAVAQGKPFFRQPLVTYEVYDWAKGDWVTFDPSKPAVLTGGETAGGGMVSTGTWRSEGGDAAARG